MINQVAVVGRLIEKPILEENNEGIKYCNITISVPRCFKNSKGGKRK